MKPAFSWVVILLGITSLYADDAPTYEAHSQIVSTEGGVIWLNVVSPLSYATELPGRLPPNTVPAGFVHGRACQHGLSLPFTIDFQGQSGQVSGAHGDGGYERALRHIKKERPEVQGLYDVQVDQKEVRILSVYSKLCTEVTARAFRRRE